MFSLGQLGDLANASFALVAVYIISEDWRAAWLLLVFTGVLVVAYRSYEGARRRTESLEQVNRFTELVGREVRARGGGAPTSCDEVRDAFDVEVVQLRLNRPGEPVRDWVLRGDVAEAESAAWSTSLEPYSTDGAAADAARTPDRPSSRELAAPAGVRDCLAVPLRSEGREVGTLVVADKLGDVADVHRRGPRAAPGAGQPRRGGDRQRRSRRPDHPAGRGA